jgi:hypothetical protein
MRRFGTGLVLLLMTAGVVAFARLSVRAQERGERVPPERTVARPDAAPGAGDRAGTATVSVQDALLRPFSFPFAKPTALADVCEHLRRALKAPVVLDLAALDRLELDPEDPVQLQLEGVRLKVGLKLLLDQVGLTFQVVPEDNLLILTDTQGSTDPIDRVLSEIKALHRDVHDLQDSVDDILAALAPETEGGGARMRKPTIIEEVPGEAKPGEKPEPPPQNQKGATDRTRTRPGT